MEILTTDLLVIGSGLAGIMAALEAEKAGLQVTIAAKFSIGMGTNSSMANGVFCTANSRFSKEDHLRETLQAGRGLNHMGAVQCLVEKGPEAMEKLREYGVPFIEGKMGYVVDRPRGSSEIPGILLMKALKGRLSGSSIKTLPGLVLFELIVEEGSVRGGIGFFRDGRPCLIRSKAVVLAAGGAGALYRRNDNQRSILGDGYALALRAGVPLLNLEFVQFYPFVIAEPRLNTFILYPPYPEEVRLLDERGEDLLERLNIEGDLNRAIVTHRDSLTLSLLERSRNGDFYFDLRGVPEERWNHYPLNFLKRSKFPFRERPFLVSPAVHFCMGGVGIDERGRTPLSKLYAAGEVTWGVHGANRLGGNALTECAVFGALAGQSAAEEAREMEWPPLSEALKRRWEKKVSSYFKKRKGVFDHPIDLLKELKHLAWKYAGPIREEGLLKEGLHRLISLESRIEEIHPDTFKDLLRKRELQNGALFLRAVLIGSLARKESRGSFFRRDFPDQNDREWLKNTCYRLVQGEIELTHLPLEKSE